jgi:hypothetical protein
VLWVLCLSNRRQKDPRKATRKTVGCHFKEHKCWIDQVDIVDVLHSFVTKQSVYMTMHSYFWFWFLFSFSQDRYILVLNDHCRSSAIFWLIVNLGIMLNLVFYFTYIYAYYGSLDMFVPFVCVFFIYQVFRWLPLLTGTVSKSLIQAKE